MSRVGVEAVVAATSELRRRLSLKRGMPRGVDSAVAAAVAAAAAELEASDSALEGLSVDELALQWSQALQEWGQAAAAAKPPMEGDNARPPPQSPRRWG